MIPEMEGTISEEERQMMMEENRAYQQAMRRAAEEAAGGSAGSRIVVRVPQCMAHRSLVPGQVIDLQSLFLMGNVRERQVIIDALYRGVALFYRAQ